MLEIALVLFLMVGMLSLVIPRMSIGDNLGSVGRKWVGAMKSFQELAMMGQKTVRLYVDIDRGMYWPMVLDGKEEKIPLDPTWAMPITLPETIRFSDVQVGATRRETGRMDIFFYPNGRIDQAIVHLTDVNNNIMGVFVEPVTSMIRITDHRIDPPSPWTFPTGFGLCFSRSRPGFDRDFPLQSQAFHPVSRMSAMMQLQQMMRRLAAIDAQGFTLFEVLIAMAILALALPILLGLRNWDLNLHSRAADITAATMLAQEKLIEAELSPVYPDRRNQRRFPQSSARLPSARRRRESG